MKPSKNFNSEIYLINSKYYVPTSFLHNYGINNNKAYKRKHNTQKHGFWQWKSIQHPADKRFCLIEYASIPQATIDEFNMPDPRIIGLLYRKSLRKKKEEEREVARSTIELIIDHAYRIKSVKIRSVYADEFADQATIELYSKSHAVLSSIVGLAAEGFRIKDLFKVYLKYDDICFKTLSYHSFANKIRSLRGYPDMKDLIIHGLKNRQGNALKLTNDVMIEIRRLYSLPNKLNASQITTAVNEYLSLRNRSKISQKTVERVLAIVSVKNSCMYGRHGKDYAKKKLLPYIHFKQPEQTGEIWYMDGSRFQFMYKTDQTQFNFLTFFIIMDGASKKILGYSYDNSENGSMVTNAFEMACKNTGYLPTEITHDNASAITKGIYNQLRVQASSWGVFWRPTPPGDSRSNPAERFFGVFQESYCKMVKGYIGEGIKSKRLNGRPSKEELIKYAKRKNVRTRQELIETLQQLILKYNNDVRKGEKSPNDKQTELKQANTIPLKTDRFCKLFWLEKEITVRSSMVCFIHNKEPYVYVIEDFEVRQMTNGKKVNVRFHPVHPKDIYIFNSCTGEFITTLERFEELPKASCSRTGEDNKRLVEFSKKRRKALYQLKLQNEALEKDSTRNWQQIPPEFSELGVYSKEEMNLAEDKYWKENLVEANRRNFIEPEVKKIDYEQARDLAEEIFTDMYNY